jgi:hypothetical protein
MCKRFCNFRTACIALDDGMDYKFILDNNFKKVDDTRDKWKKKLIYPKQIKKGENNIND